MAPEAIIIRIDNSESVQNGHYSPTRFQAQIDAVYLICITKIQFNPKNIVGVLAMAGKKVRLLDVPTSDLGVILDCMDG